MTVTPSFYQRTGLGITAFDPLLAANRTPSWHESLTTQIQNFRMEKRAIGGYWALQSSINSDDATIESWIARGLGRHIVVKNAGEVVVFEGFLNRLEAKVGNRTFTLGPLLNVSNRVQTVYSVVDNTVIPPVMGNRDRTAVSNDLSSQAQFGIIEKILSTGGSTVTEAAQNNAAYLAEHAWPETGGPSTLLGGAGGNMVLDILGYWAWLGAYVYNQMAAGGDVNASAKLQAVLVACPNAGLFSTDYSGITANTVQVSQWEDEDRKAEEVIKSVNALGTTTYGRTNVGVYNDRRIVYGPAPSSIRYIQRTKSNDLLTDLIGGPVSPWDVQPGEWVFYADLLAGWLPPVTQAQIQQDPRCGLIESVTLDNRYGLDINGLHVGTLDQLLARQGLMGVGA